MAIRTGRQVRFTICVPQISTLVASADVYLAHRREVEQMIQQVCSRYDAHFTVDLHLTTGDGAREDLIYMLYTGSCIESGDEGQVSRGNRIGGLISSRRPYTIEGLNGKNPQYHAGKIYSAAAWEIAERLWLECGQPSEVFVVSQIDRPVDDPWAIIVNTVNQVDQNQLSQICSDVLGNIGRITQGLLDARYHWSEPLREKARYCFRDGNSTFDQSFRRQPIRPRRSRLGFPNTVADNVRLALCPIL